MAAAATNPAVGQMAKRLEDYIADHPEAAVLEDGRVVFDLRQCRYSVTEQHGRCLLQFWSDERNLMRTLVEVQQRASCLRLMTRRMGVSRPQVLELVPNAERRTPTAREAARKNYQRLLERVLARRFFGAKADGFRSAMDLEHSFGPACVRGRLLQGPSAAAVVGVSEAESGSTIDGVLTIGLLWLDFCRAKADARRHFGGLKVIVPEGLQRTTAERMAWLNQAAASFELYTLNERTEELEQVDYRDFGNVGSRLVQAFSAQSALERCQSGVEQVFALIALASRSRVELRARSTTEVGLLLHGLEFARVRHTALAGSFERGNQVSFGAGPSETLLEESSEPLCRELLERLFLGRHPYGDKNDALFRLQPERWLEADLRANLAELIPSLRADLFYQQVPAISSGERGMLDLLTLDRNNRLAIIEIKANEDLHLPLQALDYWIRVRALNADRQSVGSVPEPLSAFERSGYFGGCSVSPAEPRLLLIAPALRIHPANQTVLRYFSAAIDWELVALGEHWREELRIIYRKRPGDPN